MHPLVRIICLIAFAFMVQMFHWPALAAVSALLLMLMPWCGGPTFRILLRRSRWLLLSMLLIYAYATPGQYLSGLPDNFAPTYEGLQAGLMQMGKLAAMLAALSLLLALSSREDIMVGVCLLLQPLRQMGIAPERFAARLWLTLHYVENMPDGVLRNLRRHGWCLQTALQDSSGVKPEFVQLRFPRFQWVDLLVLMLLPPLFWLLA
jgi:energy-coupling factor transporter transmembrane protein EcfT